MIYHAEQMRVIILIFTLAPFFLSLIGGDMFFRYLFHSVLGLLLLHSICVGRDESVIVQTGSFPPSISVFGTEGPDEIHVVAIPGGRTEVTSNGCVRIFEVNSGVRVSIFGFGGDDTLTFDHVPSNSIFGPDVVVDGGEGDELVRNFGRLFGRVAGTPDSLQQSATSGGVAQRRSRGGPELLVG